MIIVSCRLLNRGSFAEEAAAWNVAFKSAEGVKKQREAATAGAFAEGQSDSFRFTCLTGNVILVLLT